MAELVTRSAKEHQRHVKKTKSFPIPIRPKGGGGIGDETLVTLFKAAKKLDDKKRSKRRNQILDLGKDLRINAQEGASETLQSVRGSSNLRRGIEEESR
jgi:hypothetical protein